LKVGDFVGLRQLDYAEQGLARVDKGVTVDAEPSENRTEPLTAAGDDMAASLQPPPCPRQ
jgi:hypothetical protein